MNILHELPRLSTRRHFFGRAATGIGTVALASLLNERLFADEAVKLSAIGTFFGYNAIEAFQQTRRKTHDDYTVARSQGAAGRVDPPAYTRRHGHHY
jgi:hypothetical protein